MFEKFKERFAELYERIPLPLIFGIIVILLLVLFFVLPEISKPIKPEKLATLTLNIKDEFGNALQGLNVKLAIDGNFLEKETSKSGKINVKAPKYSSVKIIITDARFENYEESLLLDKESVSKEIILRFKSKPSEKKTIIFKDSSGLLKGIKAEATIICSNMGIEPFKVRDEDADGIVEFELPKNCGEISVSASLEGYGLPEIEFLDSTIIVNFPKLEIPKAKLTVFFEDEEGNQVIGKNIVVILEHEGMRIKQESLGYASVDFENLKPGRYKIFASDNEGVYVSSWQEFEIEMNEHKTITIVLEKRARVKLLAIVLDANTKKRIEHAQILVYKEGMLIAQTDTNNDGFAFVSLSEPGSYELLAKKYDEKGKYLPKKVNVDLNEGPNRIEIELEKLTKENSGIVVVKVLDEERNVVEGAKVFLRYSDTNEIVETAEQQNYKLTDANGIARFIIGPEERAIYPVARKVFGYANGYALAKQIDPLKENYFELTLELGKAVVEITAFSTTGERLKGCEFEIFDADNNKTISGRKAMPLGFYSYETTAAKRIYVKVYCEGYKPFRSRTITLYPEEKYDINAILVPEEFSKGPRVKFLGAFRKGKVVKKLEIGKKYEFRFLVELPDTNIALAGIHFRAGSKENVKDENFYIIDVRAKADRILKGATFSPKTLAYETPAKKEAKWVNVEWLNPKEKSFEVSFDVYIDEKAVPEEKLEFYYRAYASIASRYLRDPYDAILGEYESTSEKAGLYAECYRLAYLAGTEQLCDGKFCIKGIWLYDSREDLWKNEPFKTYLGTKYSIKIILQNNFREIKNAELRLESTEEIAFRDANVFTEDSNVSDLNIKENLLEFKINKFGFANKLELNVDFNTLAKGSAELKLSIIENKKKIYEKKIKVKVESLGELRIETKPAYLQPMYSGKLNVIVTAENLPVKDTIVTLTILADEREAITEQKYSDASGVANFEISELMPGSRIIIEASKAGYGRGKAEIIVEDRFVEADTNGLSVELITETKESASVSFKIRNLSAAPVEIKELIIGNMHKALNISITENALASYRGTSLSVLSEQEIIIPFELSKNAIAVLQGNEKVDTVIVAIVGTNTYSKELLIPLHLEILISGMPENAPCIEILADDEEWNATLLRGVAEKEFEVVNKCVLAGRPLKLENFIARIETEKPIKGTVIAKIEAPDGNVIEKVLKPNRVAKLLDAMLPDTNTSYYVTLTYVPTEGAKNYISEFEVSFDAQKKTANGLLFVGAANKITAKIRVIDLAKCISFSKRIEIESDENIATLRLKNDCDISINVYLCRGDPYCRGGTEEGGIKLAREEISFEGKSEKEVEIKRMKIPGIYGIKVEASAEGIDEPLMLGYAYVFVEPQKGYRLKLSRYEFDFNASDADSALLYNNLFIEDVNVTAKLCVKCKNIEEMPDYCLMNKALRKRAELLEENVWIKINKALNEGYKAATHPITQLFTQGVCAAACIGSGVEASALGSCTQTCNSALTVGIGIIVAIGNFISQIFSPGQECKVIDASQHFIDYVINMPADLKKIYVKSTPIIVSYANEAENIASENRQILEILLKKTAPLENKFGVLVVKYQEHIHGDEKHEKAAIKADKEFADFNIPDTKVKENVEKFHIMLVKSETVSEKLFEKAKRCVYGNKTGFTGTNALPKIKLDWRFDAIDWNTCDYDNENGIYCDATQFSIALSKRLHMLDDFFKANNRELACPKDPIAEEAKELREYFNKLSEHEVPEGKLGLSKLSVELASDSIEATVLIVNNTGKKKTVNVVIEIEGTSDRCKREVTIDGSAFASCSLPKRKKAVVRAYIVEGNEYIDKTELRYATYEAPGKCWLPYTTREIEGRPVLLYFVDRTIPGWNKYVSVEKINWPENWPGETTEEKLEVLRKLMKFKVRLMRDGFSDDFKRDFAEYYTKTFFETPEWFKKGFANYFSRNAIVFDTANVEGKLYSAGIYSINVIADFNDELAFFRGREPITKITIKMRKIKEPEIMLPIYNIPLDGEVGIESGNGRNGYGSTFDGKELLISKTSNVRLRRVNGNPITSINANIIENFKEMQNVLTARGKIIEIRNKDNNVDIKFYKSSAMPLLMKISGRRGENLKASFRVESGGKFLNWENFTYWNKEGKCKSFAENESFDYVPDEKLSVGEYGFMWNNAKRSGNFYLATAIFVPEGAKYTLKSTSENVYFYTPSERGSVITISGDKYTIKSIEGALKMVEREYACVSYEGNKMYIWWNEKALINEEFGMLEKRCG